MPQTVQKTRSEADKKYKWRIEDIYKSDKLWQKEYEEAEDEISSVQAYKGRLKASADGLFKCLENADALSMKIDRLYVYAGMRFHEDSSNAFYQGLLQKAERLVVNYSEQASFIRPEILSISDETLSKFMKSGCGIKKYTHFIENITRGKAHTLSAEEEALLAKTGELTDGAQSIFTMLNDADIRFPKITGEDGAKKELTKGNYTVFLESSDRKVRKRAFNALYDTYLKQKNTLAAAYCASVRNDVFYAKARRYSSSLELALSDDNIPLPVYDNLIGAVHKALPLLHRYVDIRKELLGIGKLHMYDLYTPLVPSAKMKITYEEAKKTVAKALAPLGNDYLAELKKGFSEGWIDVYENAGKRGGAYSWGTYSVHPYVLLNHNDNINGMFTIAHEMGHALHSSYTWKSQPYVYGGHKIFTAEVASTVNEALLMEYLLETTKDKDTKRYLINYYMEQFRGTLFRQTMFAEFEKTAHELVEQGQPLTCDALCEIYRCLNKMYFGDDIVIDDRINIEWARIPHFYNAFYVYQYATGYSAAIALSEKILKEGTAAAERYKSFLSKGSSEYSIELLKGAGVDMASPEPVEKAMAVFESLLSRI